MEPLGDVASIVIGEIIKLSVWTLPALLLIKYHQDDMWIGLKEMFTTMPKWSVAVLMLAIVVVFRLSTVLIFGGGPAVRSDFVPVSLLGVVILVGLRSGYDNQRVFRLFVY